MMSRQILALLAISTIVLGVGWFPLQGYGTTVPWLSPNAAQRTTASAPHGPNSLGTGTPLAPPVARASISDTAAAATDLPARFRNERRDHIWAGASEDILISQLVTVPMLTAEAGLQVRCATTLCEVRGFAPSGLDEDGRKIYWRMVQGPAVRSFMSERGLKVETSSIVRNGHFTIFYSKI